MKKHYTWHMKSRRPDAPHTEIRHGVPWSLVLHDGGPYSCREAAAIAARRAFLQIPEAARRDAPEIREHDAPEGQRTVDETFPQSFSGYMADIYRSADGTDCTANGESSRHARAFVLTDGALIRERGPFTVADAVRQGHPVFEVGTAGGAYHVRPVMAGNAWTMFGGNFVYSCDSRMPSHPIAIHDRIEH